MECYNEGWESLSVSIDITPIAYFIYRCCKNGLIEELKLHGYNIYNIDYDANKIILQYRYICVTGLEVDVKRRIMDFISRRGSRLSIIPLQMPSSIYNFEKLLSEVEYLLS